MSLLVIDASVAAKWCFDEEFSTESTQLISERNQLLAPDLIWSELGNIIWKRVSRGLLAKEDIRVMATTLLQVPLQIVPSQTMMVQAVELAITTGRSVYDSMYVALAVDRGCVLITADTRLFNALKPTPLAVYLRHVREIGGG